jgi:hypothetical protein
VYRQNVVVVTFTTGIMYLIFASGVGSSAKVVRVRADCHEVVRDYLGNNEV